MSGYSQVYNAYGQLVWQCNYCSEQYTGNQIQHRPECSQNPTQVYPSSSLDNWDGNGAQTAARRTAARQQYAQDQYSQLQQYEQQQQQYLQQDDQQGYQQAGPAYGGQAQAPAQGGFICYGPCPHGLQGCGNSFTTAQGLGRHQNPQRVQCHHCTATPLRTDWRRHANSHGLPQDNWDCTNI